ncbi:hypothetical protein VNO77_43341 [Canavalia gladiata]|uniref:Uncharacterized protein n=1 Tax=Canavalia gladiata TaxID=3824 RepID=A0AAN9PMU2_CANGL
MQLSFKLKYKLFSMLRYNHFEHSLEELFGVVCQKQKILIKFRCRDLNPGLSEDKRPEQPTLNIQQRPKAMLSIRDTSACAYQY